MQKHTDPAVVGRMKSWEAVITKSVEKQVVLSQFVGIFLFVCGLILFFFLFFYYPLEKIQFGHLYVVRSINSIGNIHWKWKGFSMVSLLLKVNAVCLRTGNFTEVTCFLTVIFGVVARELPWMCGHACPLRLSWDFVRFIIFLFCYF